MYAISTAALVSILALASLLAIFVQADGPRKECAQYHDVVKGETCGYLNWVYGLAHNEIHSMNPRITCDGDNPLPGGEILCVQVKTPPCTKWDFADGTQPECGGLPFKYKISRTTFVEYNDNVDAYCNNVTNAQKYCVSIK